MQGYEIVTLYEAYNTNSSGLQSFNRIGYFSTKQLAISAAEWVRNEKTGEERLVIEHSRFLKEVTFSGQSKWETARGWVPTGRHARVTMWKRPRV